MLKHNEIAYVDWQAVKCRLYRHSSELVATDAERILNYAFICIYTYVETEIKYVLNKSSFEDDSLKISPSVIHWDVDPS